MLEIPKFTNGATISKFRRSCGVNKPADETAGQNHMAKKEKRAMTKRLTKKIADEIEQLVERVGGPVTLAQIEREVAGFKAGNNATRSWEYVTGEDQDENLIWDGMTKEGCGALRKVLLERRVAMQPATGLIYFLEGACPNRHNWVPISLVPARMANADTGGVLICGSQEVVDLAVAQARDEGVVGFRLLHPTT